MNQARVLRLPKRLVIDNEVLTQLNKHCLFAIKFSRSVEFAASQSYLLNSIATRPNAKPVYTRQSLKQTMQYKHLLCCPAMQPHLLCKHLHQLLCRTSNAKHLLCKAPAVYANTCTKFPPKGRSFQIRPPKRSNPDAKFIEI